MGGSAWALSFELLDEGSGDLNSTARLATEAEGDQSKGSSSGLRHAIFFFSRKASCQRFGVDWFGERSPTTPMALVIYQGPTGLSDFRPLDFARSCVLQLPRCVEGVRNLAASVSNENGPMALTCDRALCSVAHTTHCDSYDR